MRKIVASLLAVSIAALPARGEETPTAPTCKIDGVKPAGAVKVNLNDAEGLWLDAQTAKNAAKRIEWCEDNLAKCVADRQVERAELKIPGWVWITGGVVVGFLGGFYLAKAIK